MFPPARPAARFLADRENATSGYRIFRHRQFIDEHTRKQLLSTRDPDQLRNLVSTAVESKLYDMLLEFEPEILGKYTSAPGYGHSGRERNVTSSDKTLFTGVYLIEPGVPCPRISVRRGTYGVYVLLGVRDHTDLTTRIDITFPEGSVVGASISVTARDMILVDSALATPTFRGAPLGYKIIFMCMENFRYSSSDNYENQPQQTPAGSCTDRNSYIRNIVLRFYLRLGTSDPAFPQYARPRKSNARSKKSNARPVKIRVHNIPFTELELAEQLSQAEEMDKEDNRPDEVHSYLDWHSRNEEWAKDIRELEVLPYYRLTFWIIQVKTI